MTWQQLLTQNRIRQHTTSKNELEALRGVVARDLDDAAIPGLSADRSFATAYNAALQLAKMAVACAGYRVSGIGAHQASFEAVQLAIGASVANQTAYFEACRRKRNTLDYDAAYIVSDTEASEILKQAQEFRVAVEEWIAKTHPHLAP